MPELLPIVDAEGNLLPYAPFVLLAHTTIPYDHLKFEELLASLLVQQVLSKESARAIDLPHRPLLLLREHRRFLWLMHTLWAHSRP
jgi:hypothetical protein